MLRKSFKNRIIIPVAIVLAVSAVTQTIYVTLTFMHYSNKLIDEKLEAVAESFRVHVKNGRMDTRAAALLMSENRDAVQAIKDRDRDSILRIFAPMCEVCQIDYYTVTDENGIVLARTYEPEQAGDSILNQQNVRAAQSGQVAAFVETGTRIKVAIRSGAPVYDADGTLVGLISAGIRYDTDEAVNLMKSYFLADVTIFLGETIIATTILDDKKPQVTAPAWNASVAKVIVNKTEHFGNIHLNRKTYRVFYMPITDAEENVFAVFSLAYPLTELEAETAALIRNRIIISLTGLIASIAIMYWVISSFSKPLIKLSENMNAIENGHLGVIIDAKNEDEVGYVGQSLQKIVGTIHKLIDDINAAITEREKGNMDYRIDIQSFHGYYRLLADRIMALSNMVTEDQLTKIPNRRTFDNRLGLEWERALRDQTPISLLMIDIDHFKNYNDTYGHQRGDLALQAVAKVLPQSIRRAVDFVARWGGEEFAVLLPNTDSKGALLVAELIRVKVESADITDIDGGILKKVTVSIGADTQIPLQETSIENLISNADEALYRAKEMGRNSVCRHEGETVIIK